MFESKINRGRANGYAPLDSGSKIPLSHLPPIAPVINTGSLVAQINSLSASISHISFSNTGSFATTGSNTFIGNQTIQGGVTASGFTIVDAGIPELHSSTDLKISANNINVSGTLFVSGNIYANNLTGSKFNTGSFATTGSNTFIGTQTISGSFTLGTNDEDGTTYDTISVPYGHNIWINPDTALAMVGGTNVRMIVDDGNNNLYISTSDEGLTNGVPSAGGFNWKFEGASNSLILPVGGTIKEDSSPAGLGNTITLTPYGGSDINQQLKIYPTATEGNHLHLTSGDLSITSLFLGNDSQYVRTNTNGEIVIGTNDNIPDYPDYASAGKRWRFNKSGSLITPGDIDVNGSMNISGSVNISSSLIVSSTIVNNGTIDTINSNLIIDNGNIILSGSFAQQVNYTPLSSGSGGDTATHLDITKDIHILDITDFETNCHWYLPDGLYEGQVVRLALIGNGVQNPNNVYVWPNHLRNGLGSIRNGESWSPFWDNSGGSARSLATAIYIDGAWNIDNGFYNLD